MTPAATATMPAEEFGRLLAHLHEDGYTVLGPTARDGVIGYTELVGVEDLPRGVTDEQAPGYYRLQNRDEAWFGFAVGPTSPKATLFPARQRLWRAIAETDATFRVEETRIERTRIAFVGVRPCELAAIRMHDRLFLQGPRPDPVYEAHRSDVLLVAVECGSPAATCFCASMGTGPAAPADAADLVLTELLEGGHRFLVRAGSTAGADLLAGLDHRGATTEELTARDELLASAQQRMARRLDTDGLPDLLLGNLEHPIWEELGQRCLACGNCTLVCPTCFCTTVEDTTDLTGAVAEHSRRWDSCFALDFSRVGSTPVRGSTAARYRQWMTHKLATWVEQFDTFGCVGCGRCITWCPVGIDITEEAARLRASVDRASAAAEVSA